MRKIWIAGMVTIACCSLVQARAQAQTWTGKASFYRAKSAQTCAHRSLPFGTQVRITNLVNRKSTVLVVNDRGPFIKGRIIDVSTKAAETLGFRSAGVVQVAVETVQN